MSTPALTWQGISGWFDYHAFWDKALDRVAAAPGARATFAEIGVFFGKSLAYLGAEVKRRNLDVRILAVDLWAPVDEEPDINAAFRREADPHRAFLDNMKKCGVADLVTSLRMTSAEAARDTPDASLDGVFVDADHRYGHVLADIGAWLPKVRPGGWIGGHDVDRPGVHDAVRKSFGSAFESVDRWWAVWDLPGGKK